MNSSNFSSRPNQPEARTDPEAKAKLLLLVEEQVVQATQHHQPTSQEVPRVRTIFWVDNKEREPNTSLRMETFTKLDITELPEAKVIEILLSSVHRRTGVFHDKWWLWVLSSLMYLSKG